MKASYANRVKKEEEKVKQYITVKAEEIAEKVIVNGKHRVSTCNTDSYGWDKQLHQQMPEIRREVETAGIKSSHSVSFQVYDFSIFFISCVYSVLDTQLPYVFLQYTTNHYSSWVFIVIPH